MKVAVIGGGTAGFMACAHLSQHLPNIELLHVFDPAEPTISVGEGTTPGFWSWVNEMTPASLDTMRRACDATAKKGVRFEHWGRTHEAFCHDFVPAGAAGLHLSASLLVEFLDGLCHTTRIPMQVRRVRPTAGGVALYGVDGTKVVVDLAIAALGFPAALDRRRHHRLSWIPTDAALVTRGPVVHGMERTRAVARPHGWVFVIPLVHHTSYGYVFGSRTATRPDVEEDFVTFLRENGVEPPPTFRHIRFPNFVCRTIFDGKVFRLGNAASFIEPLEATSIAVVRYHLRSLTGWLRLASSSPSMAERLVAGVNQGCVDLVLETSVFLGWHYAAGSPFDTPFWRRAERGFRAAMHEGIPPRFRAAFHKQMACATRIPTDAIVAAATREDLDELGRRFGPFPMPFGGMTPLGFAQIALGFTPAAPAV